MPFALRRFSEFCRFHSRCFAAHSAQRVCSCTAGWLQRHSPCSLRSCRVSAGFCLRVDGCGFGAWADFFWLGRVDFRLGPDFIRLRVRLGINIVSIKSCGFKVFIPTPGGRNRLSSRRPTPREYVPGPRTWMRWSTASCTCCAAAYPVGSVLPPLGSACLPMCLGAIWTAGLVRYDRLPAIFAEALLFEFAAFLSGACPSPFLSFFWREAHSLRLLGCFRLCGFYGRGF